MAGVTRTEEAFDVSCPHCKKPFTATLFVGSARRYHGFKCPHCKLFVPFERVDEAAQAARLD